MFYKTYSVSARAYDRHQNYNRNLPKRVNCPLSEVFFRNIIHCPKPCHIIFCTQKWVLLLLIPVLNHRRYTLKIKSQTHVGISQLKIHQKNSGLCLKKGCLEVIFFPELKQYESLDSSWLQNKQRKKRAGLSLIYN